MASNTSGLTCTPRWLLRISMDLQFSSRQIVPATSPSDGLQIAVVGIGNGLAMEALRAITAGSSSRSPVVHWNMRHTLFAVPGPTKGRTDRNNLSHQLRPAMRNEPRYDAAQADADQCHRAARRRQAFKAGYQFLCIGADRARAEVPAQPPSLSIIAKPL